MKLKLLLSQIEPVYRCLLFPWYTKEALQRHEENGGISEFAWVLSPRGKRKELMEFLNRNYIVTIINTTWVAHTDSKKSVGREIEDSLVYLPSIHQMNEGQIIKLGQALAKYCSEYQYEYDRNG